MKFQRKYLHKKISKFHMKNVYVFVNLFFQKKNKKFIYFFARFLRFYKKQMKIK